MTEDCQEFVGSWATPSFRSALYSGAWTGKRLAYSPQLQAVIETYRRTLCRDPEPGGRVYWTESGASREQMAAAMRATGEWAALQPVRNLYLDLLARDPVPGNCRFVFQWMRSGKAIEVIATEIAASPEGQRVRAVRDLYLELLGRDPVPEDRAGLRGWVDSGLALETIRAGIAASPEAQARQGGGAVRPDFARAGHGRR